MLQFFAILIFGEDHIFWSFKVINLLLIKLLVLIFSRKFTVLAVNSDKIKTDDEKIAKGCT